MRLEEFSSQIGSMMVSAKFENRRFIAENEDILVAKSITTFDDGGREAVLLSALKNDGLLWRTETGAMPLSSKD